MKQLVAFILLPAISLASCSHVPNKTSEPNEWKFCYHQMDEDAAFLAGKYGDDCGFVSLKDSAEKRTKSKQCARASIKENRAFRVGYQGIGKDSGYCEVVISDPDRQWVVLEVDYDQSGGILTGDGPILQVLECSHVEFKLTNSQLFRRSGCRNSSAIYDTLPSNKP